MAKKVAKKAVKKTTKKKSIAIRIKEAKRAAEKAREKANSLGQELFREAVVEIFDKFPSLEQFSWDEYTPHWNDGDECVFSCYFGSLAINDEKEKGNVEEVWSLENTYKLLKNKEKEEARIILELSDKDKKQNWEIEHLKNQLEEIKTRNIDEVKEKYEIKKTITELLEDIDTDAYESMFGEGTVVVYRDGSTNVEACEHD